MDARRLWVEDFPYFQIAKKQAANPPSCTLCSAMMVPPCRFSDVALAQKKWSQGDIPASGQSQPPSTRENPAQLCSSSNTILALCHHTDLFLCSNSWLISEKIHRTWMRFQSKPQIGFTSNVYSAVVSTSGWENKYLIGNKLFKRLEK